MRWPPLLLYPILLAYGLGFAFSPTLVSGFRQLQTDPGDTILNHYFLEHSWRWVSQPDYRGALWSPTFFYPEKDVLGYSDNLFGAAPVYWLLRCGLDDVPAYQLWMMVGFAANFVAMAVVLRWFALSHALCALGAFLFAFGTPHVQQIGHQQLTYRCWTPFAIWYGWRFLREPSGGALFGCLFCIAWQFIAVVYVGWFVAFGLGCVSVILLLTNRDSRTRLWRFVRERPLAAACPVLLNGLLVAAVVVPYLRANQGYQREPGEALVGAPRWNSWLAVPPGTLWHPLVESIPPPLNGEHFLGGGLAFLALATLCAVTVLRRKAAPEDRLLIRTFALTCVLLLALTLSVWVAEDRGGSLWYGVYYVVPGAKAIRVPARVYLILYPLLTVAGLLALQRLLDGTRLTTRWRAALVGALIVVAAAENYFPQVGDRSRSFEARPFYAHARTLARELNGTDAAYGLSEMPGAYYEHELTMMWAGLYANVPVVNGYSGREPRDYPSFRDDFSIDLLKGWLGPGWRGTFVVVTDADPVRRDRWQVNAEGEWERLE
jgi:hypothetical protein